jgi:hypothetical protein
MKSPLRLLTALACSGASALAAAQRSGLGADSAVADAGDCEVETAFEHGKKRGEAAQRGSALRFACGIGWRTELEAKMAWTRAGIQHERVLALDAKTSLRDRQRDAVGWALGLGIDAQRLDGRWRRSEQRVELEASRQFGALWLGEAQLGTVRDSFNRRRSTTWALSVEYAWNERVEVRAELSGDDRDKPFLALGWRRAVWGEDLQLELTWAERLAWPRERKLALALQYEF